MVLQTNSGILREGKAVHWDASALELAQVVHCTHAYLCWICAALRRTWNWVPSLWNPLSWPWVGLLCPVWSPKRETWTQSATLLEHQRVLQNPEGPIVLFRSLSCSCIESIRVAVEKSFAVGRYGNTSYSMFLRGKKTVLLLSSSWGVFAKVLKYYQTWSVLIILSSSEDIFENRAAASEKKNDKNRFLFLAKWHPILPWRSWCR